MITFVGSIALAAGIIYLIVYGVIWLAGATRTDVHHSGSMQHQITGTIRHDVSGSVQHQHLHLHGGTVQHVHQLDPADRDRLDQLQSAQPVHIEQLNVYQAPALQWDDQARRYLPRQPVNRQVIDATPVRRQIER